MELTNVFLIIAIIITIAFIIKSCRRKGLIIYFYKPKCGYCTKMMPTWKQLCDDKKISKQYTLRKINCASDDGSCVSDMKICGLKKISAVPLLVILRQDGSRMIMTGERTYSEILPSLYIS
jgi:hypothetical protein